MKESEMAINIEAGKFYKTRDGRKVGPMVDAGGDDWPFYSDGTDGAPCWKRSGEISHKNVCMPLDLISEWPAETPSPVRSVTRTEIVPGVYGRLRVIDDAPDKRNGVGVTFVMRGTETVCSSAALTASELRAASLVLGQLADALSGGEGNA